jgi:hypothetical protein
MHFALEQSDGILCPQLIQIQTDGSLMSKLFPMSSDNLFKAIFTTAQQFYLIHNT